MTELIVHSCISRSTASSPVLSTRHGFSNRHLMAARKFARELESHEKRHVGEAFGPAFDDAQWFAMAAFIMSYSALEAWTSETTDDLKISQQFWKKHERRPLFDRCDAILRYRQSPPLDRTTETVRAVKTLAAIRNGLVHPK